MILDNALELMRAGFSVIPTKTDGTKAPLGLWGRYQSECADEEQLTAWFGNGHPGMGVVCGAASGNLEMLELEGRATNEGVDAQFYAALHHAGHDDLLTLIMTGFVERSPSGGIHFFYRVNGIVPGNTKLASRDAADHEMDQQELERLNRTGRRPPRVLIETRGEGGYVVVAPSGGPVHRNGQPWLVVAGGPATVPVLSTSDREALWSAAATCNRYSEPERVPIPAYTAPVPIGSGELSPGDDFNIRGSWHDILMPHGWTIESRGHGDQIYWSRPGKRQSEGKSAVTGGPDGDRYYGWTTSTELPAEEALSKWRVYAQLNCAGDYSRAASELRQQGYGSVRQPGYHGSEQDRIDRAVFIPGPVQNGTMADPANARHLSVVGSDEPIDDGTQVDPVERLMAEFHTSDELAAMPRPEPLIEGFIDAGNLALLYGEPGSLKSFVVLDMLECINHGSQWHGIDTRQTNALYVSAEGGRGVQKRLEAWSLHYGQPSMVRVITRPIDIFKGFEIESLVEVCRRMEVGIIAFDTFNRTTPGLEENSAKDTGIVLGHVQKLTRAGITVLIVHHTPRSADNPRGSTALEGSTDHGIRIERRSEKDLNIELINRRQKDYQDGQVLKFKGVLIESVNSIVITADTDISVVSDVDDLELAILEHIILKGPIGKTRAIKAITGGRETKKSKAFEILVQRAFIEATGTVDTVVGSKQKVGGADLFEATEAGRRYALAARHREIDVMSEMPED